MNKKMFKKMRASSQVSERAGGESRVADTGSLSSPADILCHSILTSTFSSSSRLNFTVFYSNLTLSTLLLCPTPYFPTILATLLYFTFALFLVQTPSASSFCSTLLKRKAKVKMCGDIVGACNNWVTNVSSIVDAE